MLDEYPDPVTVGCPLDPVEKLSGFGESSEFGW
jgi:hypothetical protein